MRLPSLRLVSMVTASAFCAVMASAAAVSCSLDTDAHPCTTADDCSTPYLCCTAGVVLEVEGGGSRCVIPEPSLSFCEAYLPHLVEGNPCGRAPLEPGAVFPPPEANLCRDGLTCCPDTLTCVPTADCAATESPTGDGTSTRQACRSDDTCPSGEICCGISYFDRDGACATVGDCAADVAAPVQ